MQNDFPDIANLSLPIDNETKLRIIHVVTCVLQQLHRKGIEVDPAVSILSNTVCHNLAETVLGIPDSHFDETDLQLLKASVDTILMYYKSTNTNIIEDTFRRIVNAAKFNNPN